MSNLEAVAKVLNTTLKASLIGLFLLGSLALQAKIHFFDSSLGGSHLKEGAVAPDFTLKTIDDKSVSLADYKGRPVVIDFFATWCGSCKIEMLSLKKWHQYRLKKKLPEIPVLIISQDSDVDDLRRYQKKHESPFVFLSDAQHQIAESYKVGAIPTVYFVGSNGRIAEAEVGAQPSIAYTLDRAVDKDGECDK